MPTFLVTAPDGRRLKLTGDTPPTDTDLDEIFSSLPTPTAERQPSAGEMARASIEAEIDRKTAEAAPDETWGKALVSFGAAEGRSFTDTIQGGARLLGLGDAAAKLLSPLTSSIEEAEFAAEGMKGNEILSAVTGTLGSSAASVVLSALPGGAVVSAGAAGLQGFESTRRDALKLILQAGVAPDEAEKIATRVGLQAGVITGAVTGAFNRYAGKLGLGKGVERGLSSAVRELTAKELQRTAAVPIVKAVLKEAGGEGLEEGTDTLLQETITRWQYDPSTSLKEYAKRALADILKAGALGTVAGGVVGGGGAAAQVVGERRVAVARLRAGDQGPVTGVPGDTSALATPMRIPEPTESATPADPAKPDAPGTYVFGTLPDGREVKVTVPEGGDVKTARDYMAKAMPEATFSRVEVVASPEVTAPTQGAEATAEPGGANPEASSVPTPAAPPASAQEGVTPNEEEGQGQEVLTQPDAVAASTPAAPPKRRRIARAAIGDILDDIEQAGGLMSRTEAEARGFTVGPEWDDAPQGLPVAHRFIFGNGAGGKGTLTPDKALQALQGQFPEKYGGLTVPEMWAAIEAASNGRVAATKRRKAEIADTKAAIDWEQSALEPGANTEGVLAGDLGVGEVLTIDGEKVRVKGYDRDGNVILDDGKRFGRQRVDGGQIIYAEKIEAAGATGQKVQQSPDAPFSIRQDGFFDAPESVEEQKARMAREEAARKKAEDRQKMLDRQAAPLRGRAVDTTGDMFDPLASEAPLFATRPPTKPTPARGQQGELFSVAPAPDSGMLPAQVESELQAAFGGRMPARVVVSGEAPRVGGGVAEAMLDKRTGTVTIFAPNLRNAADVRRVARHEFLHDVFEDGQVQGAWRTLRTFLTGAAQSRVRGEGYTENVDEEALIDEIEARVDRQAGPFRRFIGRIVDALGRRGRQDIAGALFGLDHLADADARALVGYAMRVDRMEGTRGEEGEGSRQSIRTKRRWSDIEKYLTEAEKNKAHSGVQRSIARIIETLPTVTEFAAAAVAGLAKKGWYRKSAQALVDVFRGDAPRFAALLAALSPQTSVESNLTNALQVWAGWEEAWRPTDRAEIVRIMGENVIGKGTEASVLQAWVNNSVASLTSDSPDTLVLSGPKVNSFAANLRGLMNEITNDTWMANFSLIRQALFGGSKNKSGPGKGSGYKAMNAVVRETAEFLERETGETWSPAEVQETVWSFTKALVEMSEATGIPAGQILETGALTDSVIAETPDFATLLSREPYRSILEGAGLQVPQADPESGGRSDSAATLSKIPGGHEALSVTARRLENLAAYRAQLRGLTAELSAAEKQQQDRPTKTGAERVERLERRIKRLNDAMRGVKSVDFAETRFSIRPVTPDARPARDQSSEPNAQQSGQGSRLSLRTLWRAGDADEVGIKPWASFTEDKATAEAYLDNPGFGGETLRSVEADINPDEVLNADTHTRRGMQDLAAKIGLERDVGEEWFDNGWRYPWEESKSVKDRLRESGFKWLRYVDDFPEGASTIIRIVPFDSPAPEQGADSRLSIARRTPETRTTEHSNATVIGPAVFSIRAYHGTPHKVDRFSTEKIGTGEGAQAYGWGLYFAEKREVAIDYRDRLAGATDPGRYTWRGQTWEGNDYKSPERHAVSLAYHQGVGTARQIAKLGLKDARNGEPYAIEQGGVEYYSRMLETANAIGAKREIEFEQGQLYTVELDANEDELLDLDQPLSRQPQAVQDAARELLVAAGHLRPGENGPRQLTSAWAAYRLSTPGASGNSDAGLLYDKLGKTPEESSRALLARGIKGIQYLDAGSRGAKKKTRNFVVFDDRFIRIVGDSDTRLSIRNVPADQIADEPERQKQAGRAPTVISSELAWDGARVMEEQNPRGFEAWRDAMLKRHGEAALPFLSRAWEDALDVRYSLANGIPPQVQDDINRIESAAEAAPRTTERKPVPAYDPTKVKEWWHGAVRPSDVIRYFGGDDLLRKKNLLDLRTAYQQAAVQEQSRRLTEALEDSFYGDHAGPILRALRRFMPRTRFRRFMRHALPIAAHLNVTGGTSGAWTFADFDQRAGFMPESEANRHGITSGDSIMRANPVTGALETLVLGPKMTLEKGPKGFQILRKMTADRQAGVYQWARAEFPEFMWFLDTWLDPRLRNTRVEINGVELPIFNRWALATRYAQADPKFVAREAYTPDVSIGAGLLGAMKRQFRKERKWSPKDGTVSPGRKYETGTARESGDVLDLLSGFNVRAMQVLQEDVRKQWAKDVLASAADVPPEGLPESWVPIETAMDEVWRAVQAMQKFDDPLNFPSVTDRLRDDDSPEYKKFFGELTALRRANTPKMVPRPLVEALRQDMATTKELGLVGEIFRWWARNWKAALLLMPDTFIENRTDNYLRLLMQSYRQLILSAMRGGDRQAFREARHLAWAAMTGVVPGIRQLTGLNRNRLFNDVVRSTLPPELFSSGHKLADLWIDKGGLEEEIASDLTMGRRGRAVARAAANLPAVVLEKTGYSDMDVTAKQQFAFATLLAAAETEGRRRGLRGDVFEQFVEAWVKKPPEAAIRRAVEGANRLLLNYNDTPGWLAKIARNPVSNLLVAFPLFRYHFVGREIDRATSALRSFINVATRNKKLTRDQWAAALADTISYITLPIVGYAGVKVVGALADSLIGAPGGDDDDDPRNVVGSGVRLVETPEGDIARKPLARELVTANRINLSAIMRQMGVDTGNPSDYWWHAKDYPIVRSVALVYQAMEDARRHGPTQGLVSLFGGLKEFLGSIAGVGQIVKVPAKIAAEIEGAQAGRPAFTGWDPYATGVPLDAYLTMQALNLIPGQRQANEVMKWLDPTPRRMTRSKSLDYDPGVREALQAEGWTGLADRMARLAMTGDAASPLPPQGTINRRTGTVDTPRTFDLTSRIAALLGQNIKPVPRDEYRDAVAE